MNLKEIVMKKFILQDLHKELKYRGLRLDGKFSILARYLQGK